MKNQPSLELKTTKINAIYMEQALGRDECASKAGNFIQEMEMVFIAFHILIYVIAS